MSYCPKCGNQVAESDAFCRSCGTALRGNSAVSAAVAPSLPSRRVTFHRKRQLLVFYVQFRIMVDDVDYGVLGAGETKTIQVPGGTVRIQLASPVVGGSWTNNGTGGGSIGQLLSDVIFLKPTDKNASFEVHAGWKNQIILKRMA